MNESLSVYEKLTVLTNQDLQSLVESISLTCFQKPFQHCAVFNARLKTTGGRYHLNDHHLDFNYQVFQRYGMEEMIKVIKHELCHYHLHREGKGYKHRDPEFRQLLAQTGGSRFVPPLIDQKPENYHQYECEKCQTLILRKRRINTQKYGCKCGGKLIHLG